MHDVMMYVCYPCVPSVWFSRAASYEDASKRQQNPLHLSRLPPSKGATVNSVKTLVQSNLGNANLKEPENLLELKEV